MESNFIKERVVVREKVIKEGLNSTKRTYDREIQSSTSYEYPPERVIALEEVVNDRLRHDLADLSKRVDYVCQTIADYLKVKSALKVFQKNPHDVRLLTNIGCNFYAQCHVNDASKIYLCIGKDYFLHVELSEAISMIEFKENQWGIYLDALQEKAAVIKGYIKVALEAMGRVYEIDRDKLMES